MAHGGARALRGEPDSARRWEGSGEGGREHLLREPKGKERGEGASELGKWRTARRGRCVAVAFRAAVLGMCAGRRRRVGRSRSVGRIRERVGDFGREERRVIGGETAMNGEATALRQGRRRWWRGQFCK